MTDKENPAADELKFDENPYDPSRKRPEDVVRLFYKHNVPLIPVVSKRGMLLGILKKEDVIAELSDIDRVEKLSIDAFITRLAKRMSFDALLGYGRVREFIVINIFGEMQGKWTRLQLFSAVEEGDGATGARKEVEDQKEEQALEWMIYLILEHIPRALYAMNVKNRTIFYNSHFEEMYRLKFNSDVDTASVEKFFKNPNRNRLETSGKEGEHNFFNEDLGVHYEKIPMMSNRKKAGYLIFCLPDHDVAGGGDAGGSVKGKTLAEVLEAAERRVVTETMNRCGNLREASESLGISVKQLNSRIKKLSIHKN